MDRIEQGERDPRMQDANEESINRVVASYLDEAHLKKGHRIEGEFRLEDEEAHKSSAAYASIERIDEGAYIVGVLRDTDEPDKDMQPVMANYYKVWSDELGVDVRSVTALVPSTTEGDQQLEDIRNALDSEGEYTLNKLTYDDVYAIISALKGAGLTESAAPDLPQQAWHEAVLRSSGKDGPHA